jgi:hypothetical protein
MRSFDMKESSVFLLQKSPMNEVVLILECSPKCFTAKQLLLFWKLDEEAYAPHSNKKCAEINALWLEHQDDQNTDDIMMPPELEKPEVPQVNDAELRCA